MANSTGRSGVAAEILERVLRVCQQDLRVEHVNASREVSTEVFYAYAIKPVPETIFFSALDVSDNCVATAKHSLRPRSVAQSRATAFQF